MSALDGLAAGLFKTGKSGQRLFYPWGVIGQGFVLESAAQEAELRTWIKKCLILTLSDAAFSQVMVGFQVLLAILPLALIYYRVAMGLKLRHAAVSHERLRLLEAYRNAARAYRMTTLLVMEGCALGFIVAGSYLAWARGEMVFGVIAVAVSLPAALALGYMIATKRGSRPISSRNVLTDDNSMNINGYPRVPRIRAQLRAHRSRVRRRAGSGRRARRSRGNGSCA